MRSVRNDPVVTMIVIPLKIKPESEHREKRSDFMMFLVSLAVALTQAYIWVNRSLRSILYIVAPARRHA